MDGTDVTAAEMVADLRRRRAEFVLRMIGADESSADRLRAAVRLYSQVIDALERGM